MSLATERRERQELEELYRDVALEIRSRTKVDGRGQVRVELPAAIRRLRRQAPMLALEAVGKLAATLRQATGREVIDIAAMMAIVQFLYQQAEATKREDLADEFGFDPVYTESFLPVFRWIYHSYWRVVTTGVENVPVRGRALLVANHAGVLPWDGAMIKTALFEEHPQPRHARALVASLFFGLPGLSWFLRRTGQAVGHPDDAHRLLEQDELVLVFPEGVKGTGKGWSNRYRLSRFGRGGYVQTAIRAGAPIVPISVVGSEEIYPMNADLPAARSAGDGAAALEVADPVPRTDPDRPLRAWGCRRPAAGDDPQRPRPRHHPGRHPGERQASPGGVLLAAGLGLSPTERFAGGSTPDQAKTERFAGGPHRGRP